MTIGRGLSRFSEGLVSGYATAQKNKREQEIHDAQMTKIRDEQAMNAEIKNLSSAKAVQSEAFTVTDGEGNKTVYASAEQAHDAVAHTPGAQVEKKIMVAGKAYDHQDEAQAAVEAANSPLAKARKAAEIATKYTRPDVADMFMKQYKMGVDANRQDAQQAVIDASQTGDFNQLAKLYNERLPNGQHVEFAVGDDGNVTKTLIKNGKPVGTEALGKPADVWAGALKVAATTPDNIMEVWRHTMADKTTNRGLDIQDKNVAQQGKMVDANVAHVEAETKQMPEELGIKRSMAAAAQTSAGAAATGASAQVMNATTAQQEAAKPKVYTGIDDKGQEAPFAVSTPYDQKTKQYGLNVTLPQPIAGIKPQPKFKPDPFAAMFTGGAALTPEQLAAQMAKAFPPKNIGGAVPPVDPNAPRKLGGGLQSTFPSR